MDLLQLEVTKLFQETENAVTILLQRVDKFPIDYQAGQFLTLLFYRHGKELRRSYSISSTPGVDDDLSITVKRQTNGEISRFILDHLQIGDRVLSLPPAGRFVIDSNSLNRRNILFVVAGSGIAPVFSLLKKIWKEEPLTRTLLIYQNHNENSILFKQPLAQAAITFRDRFTWINLLSRPTNSQQPRQRLTNSLLEKLLVENMPLHSGNLCYICGPFSFMRMAQFTLKLAGWKDDQIRKENFTVEFIPPPPLIADPTPKKILLHYHNKQFLFRTEYPTTILQAALDNKIQLPYSCRAGRCAACIARCVAGKIKMSNNEVLTDKDLEQGWILTCVGYALTDLELEC